MRTVEGENCWEYRQCGWLRMRTVEGENCGDVDSVDS